MGLSTGWSGCLGDALRTLLLVTEEQPIAKLFHSFRAGRSPEFKIARSFRDMHINRFISINLRLFTNSLINL